MSNGTCNPKCKWWKKYKEGCPNYIESVFIPHGSNQPIIYKDCAPKRAMLMIQDLSNRLLAMQKETNIEREAQLQTSSLLVKTIQLAQEGMIQVISPKNTVAQIGNKDA